MILLFWGSGCTTIVRPVYLDEEKDLSTQILQGKKDVKKAPTPKKVSELLSNALLYHTRMSAKVHYNNQKAQKP